MVPPKLRTSFSRDKTVVEKTVRPRPILGASSTPPTSTTQKNKRKRGQEEEKPSESLNSAGQGSVSIPSKKRATQQAAQPTEQPAGEKRLRPFRKHAPQSYLERLDRATSQRMFLIDRRSNLYHREEVFDIAGTTGNVYQVKISNRPSCTCPDGMKGNQCKHVIYVVVIVLKAPAELQYQLSFLDSELEVIFSSAPKSPQSSSNDPATSASESGTRKVVEGDCPVCMTEMDSKEEVVWCRDMCGNNIHRQCFEQWAASKAGQTRCVYCRTPWKEDENAIKTISKSGKKNSEGYVNVASQLGLSGQRDTSSYHYWQPPYYRRTYTRGPYSQYRRGM